MHSLFLKAERAINQALGEEQHSHTSYGYDCTSLHPEPHRNHRFQSFVPPSAGDVKWYVDGASYFWALSEALEKARETIYILDWWLSPELYLRRPPSQNEQYRLDNMLKAAAERGVKVKVIVYKEVEAALTLDSNHTRRHLEALHPNISVFRHPDHAPTGYDLKTNFSNTFSGVELTAAGLSKLSSNVIKDIYGTREDVILYWAHHEKMCLIDNRIGFMGGLDACFGRWDTSDHPIADVHPENLDNIIFPGQDYNNARVFDFSDVKDWQQNKLDRTRTSRMGWSDLSLCMMGPITASMQQHFTERWNFLYDDKYSLKNPGKYHRLGNPDEPHKREGEGEGEGQISRMIHHGFSHMHSKFNKLNLWSDGEESEGEDGEEDREARRHKNMPRIQLLRSASKWSHNCFLEHSIANAYIDTIHKSKHFIYIENQFFITATSDEQHPVSNKVGAALADRIVRAHQAGERFLIIVVMPAVPAFAGDLKSDGALGTRAIMEFQYNSICRGGYSIMEMAKKRGVPDPSHYIQFYNLRNFDRINVANTMREVERESGVYYEDARREHDDQVGAGYGDEGEGTYGRSQYDRYQRATAGRSHEWDTISSCYMDGGRPLDEIPWNGSPEDEIDAFVSEELYVHTKIMIVDDRVVICGSANMNDRSQCGDHDSEIAVIIEDPTPVDSHMGGAPWRASRFAASLRRYLFRKHLGLLPPQHHATPTPNWHPVDAGINTYDFGSAADALVEDPISHRFRDLWRGTAHTNTEVFSKVFHNVPNDCVRTWEQYDEFFSKHFRMPDGDARKDEKGEAKDAQDGKVEYGHVVKSEFPGGVQEVKEWLGRVRGTLVEMPLQFLADVGDIAEEGLTLNAMTDELYT
ncbi:hypothetical protein TD95_000597 [Thielaviopsis punctulata]|uniref:Phospholipase n=1 Tax=Thielaviopsis punctulata TaxID=72032 RepID=A0A0F4ZLQ4_9PEZI|nr:hypothetical protein TD95_000597 [Thielaviopsis punctulata]